MDTNLFLFLLEQAGVTTFTLVDMHNGDSVTLIPGSLVSAILRDLNRQTTRSSFCLSAKVAFTPPGGSWLGWVEGGNEDQTRIDGSPNLPNPNTLDFGMNTARACLLFSNLTLA